MWCDEEVLRRLPPRALFSILLLRIVFGFVGIASCQSSLAQLKVTGVRKMTDAEYAKRISLNPERRYIVRFRLEVSGDQGIYLLTFGPKGSPPLGGVLERSENGIIWLGEATGEDDRNKGATIQRLSKVSGARWIFLPASAAYEWEIETKPSRAGMNQSRSIFVRKDMKARPTELVSAWYAVGENGF